MVDHLLGHRSVGDAVTVGRASGAIVFRGPRPSDGGTGPLRCSWE
jgi:hypothetical protein